MKKVTVHHQGDVVGKDTVIVDEDGQVMENVKAATIYLTAGELAEVTLELNRVGVVVEGNITEVKAQCPCCDVMLTHECKDPELGKPIDPNEPQTFMIQNFYLNPSSGGQMVNGVWTPSQPMMGNSGSITVVPLAKP